MFLAFEKIALYILYVFINGLLFPKNRISYKEAPSRSKRIAEIHFLLKYKKIHYFSLKKG